MRKSKYPEGTVCSVSSCDRLRRKRDWCDGHYSRWKTSGDVQETTPLPPQKKSPICIIKDCLRQEHARGLCTPHYNQTTGFTPPSGDETVRLYRETCSASNCEDLRSAGSLCDYHIDLDLRRSTGEFTFQDILRVRETTETGCWIHKNRTNDYGYNSLRVGIRVRGIHRVSYALSRGIDVDSIDDSLVVMHTCDNPPCFNPEHLKLGTGVDNMLDASNKRRLKSGSDSHFAVLTESDVLEIRNLCDKYSVKNLASRYGVHVVTIYDILNRKTWKHINDQ